MGCRQACRRKVKSSHSVFAEGFHKFFSFACVKCLRQMQTHNPHWHMERKGFVKHEVCCKQVLFDASIGSESMLFFWLSRVQSCLYSTQFQICKRLYKNLTTVIGRKSDVEFAPLIFGNMLNIVCLHVSGAFPVNRIVRNNCNSACNIPSGEWCRSSATSPASSAALFAFNHATALFSSGMV